MRYSKSDIILFLVLLGFFSAQNNFGQFSKFELHQISQDHGLPGVTAKQVFQDSKGLMWISVESYGLAKYDGYEFKLFSYDVDDTATIMNNVIEAITEDAESNIWAGTIDGISILNRKEERFRRIGEKKNSPYHLPGRMVHDFEECENGDIWVATNKGAALYSAKTKLFSHFLSDESENYEVTDIEQTPDGDIWFATSKGLYKQSKDSAVVPIMIEDPITANKVNIVDQIESLNDSVIVFSSYLNLYAYKFTNNSITKLNLPERRLPYISRLDDIERDQKGNLWFVTSGFGLSVYFPDADTVQDFVPSIYKPKGIKSTSIKDIYVDKTGLVWMAMKFEGLQCFNYQNLVIDHIFRDGEGEDKMRNRNLISLMVDSTQKLWIGANGGAGLSFYDLQSKKLTKAISQYPELDLARIDAIVQDSARNVWLGTTEYLYKSNEDFTKVERIRSMMVVDLMIDKEGILWIGKDDGMLLYDKGEFIEYNDYVGRKSKASTVSIKTLGQDSKGNIWIGSKKEGLCMMNKENRSEIWYTSAEFDNSSISGDYIRGIHEDTYGAIWVTTRGSGLNRFNWSDSTFKRLTIKNGLPSNTLFGILEDSSKNLWISTYNGICKYNYENNTIESYSLEYGLQNHMFEPNATAMAKDGSMFFGGNNGFNHFKPSDLEQYDKSVPLILTSIKVFNETVYSDVTSSIAITLPHNHNSISFNFALLDYSSSLGKKYKFMLEGFDNEWVYSSYRHYASYTNLMPGDYVFNLEARNKEGFVNNNDIKVHIHIETPIWRKLWFQVAMFLFVAFFIYFLIAYRLRKVGLINAKLKRLVNEKTAHLIDKNYEITEQKLQLEEQTVLLTKQNRELEKQKAELEEQTEKLDNLNHDLKLSNNTKNTLISIISHDLKNQFSPILGITKVLIQKVSSLEDKSFERHLRSVDTAASKVYVLMKNLLYWYRIQNDKLQPQTKPIVVPDLLNSIKNLYLFSARQKDIAIEISAMANIAVLADQEMLNAILRNLVNNAIKFTPEGGTIKLMCFEYGNSADIMVFDSGKGIKKTQLELLFDFKSPYRNKPEGTGLGLQICKEFTEAMNGTISVSSEEGKGSCFTLSLPKAFVADN